MRLTPSGHLASQYYLTRRAFLSAATHWRPMPREIVRNATEPLLNRAQFPRPMPDGRVHRRSLLWYGIWEFRLGLDLPRLPGTGAWPAGASRLPGRSLRQSSLLAAGRAVLPAAPAGRWVRAAGRPLPGRKRG